MALPFLAIAPNDLMVVTGDNGEGGAARGDDGRDIAGNVVASLVGYIRRAVGDEAVAEMLQLGLAITPAVRIDHSYLPNDFTMYLFHRPPWEGEKKGSTP